MASGQPDVGSQDPHGEVRGGRRLSAGSGVAEVLACPASREPGAENVGRQDRLLDQPPVSVVGYGRLKELARARVRRVAREMGFDWERFLAGEPEWSLTEVVHRKAVQAAAGRGLDVRPTDVPTDTVLKAVRAVLEEMDADPALRPSEAGFRAEQMRRGEVGRQSQQVKAEKRKAAVMELVASGVTKDPEIAKRLGIARSTVGRIRKRVAAAARAAEEVDALEWTFPAENVAAQERWPAVQFVKQTGVYLDEGQARSICDLGRCYEAEGRVDDLMHAIRASAGSDVRDPWAYLQRCVRNRGDAWTATPQLVADVLVWAGEESLRYALTVISGGYVQRPRAYLHRTLQYAVASGERAPGCPERPVAMAMAMCRQWAPELVVDGVAVAVDAEAEASRIGYVRTGPEPVASSGCCIGLNGDTGDELDSEIINPRFSNSSPGTRKANATSLPPRDGEKSEQGLRPAELPDSDEIRRPQNHGEALERADTTCSPLPRGNPTGFLEHGPCRHPLAALLASGMDLEAVRQVQCASGCGHRLYSDRGALVCPCHWSPAVAAGVARSLCQVSPVRFSA